MQRDFVADILRATGSLRAGDPAGATAIIQAALAAGGLSAEPAPPPDVPRRRQPLGEVVRALAEGRKRLGLAGELPGLPIPAPAPELPVPDGAEFRDLHFSCPQGTRRYRLYLPSSAGDGLQGLIVMLHGCTQSPEDFAAGTGMNALAERHRLLVAYPAQAGGDNPFGCWNWFRPQDQRRGSGEPAILAGLTARLRDDFAVPPHRVFVAGLSAGGSMAATLAETYPELYAAVGIHSGLAPGSANDVVTAFAAMRGQAETAAPPHRGDAAATPRVIVFHGSADPTVHPINAERIVARLAGPAEPAARSEHGRSAERRGYARTTAQRPDGTAALECWIVEDAPHAWSGGHPSGSYTDPRGPDASAEMVRFFLQP